MFPTNKLIIEDNKRVQSGSESQINVSIRKGLLDKWAMLHLVRTVGSVISFGAMLFGLNHHKLLHLGCEHGHSPNPEFIEVKKTREQIKQRVINEQTPIGKIYDEEMSKTVMNSVAIAIFPTINEIYHSAAKNRRKVIPPILDSFTFDIPEEFKSTIENKRFLFFDECRIRRERLLLFASDVQLDLLFNSSTIYMDGTYKKAPDHFTQIYIIHVVHFDICVPCVFGLLLNKKASTYKVIFNELKNAALQKGSVFSPKVIMTDFEPGAISAVKDEMIDDTLRALCRKLMALPLMPHDKIVYGFDEIREAADYLPGKPMIQLLQYFDNNWMSDINLWNVFGLDSRTNNVCEGYHNRMNSRIYRHHPNIWDLINFMKAEEKRVQNIKLQWSSGASKPKNKRTTALQNRINMLYDRYRDYLITASDLLNGLSLFVAKKV
ncbi:unnamed protein product [Rotaria sordida]|uniref:MULE transposase domain-containing protein n=1 Tax=Rotaria sordida TaxID=392033 RepID=A0A815ABR6_9BILA|nr:unnamed protein product [Rotaria sordida]